MRGRISEDNWFLLISVIVGGVIGYLGIYIQHLVTNDNEKKKLKREKLEEIYTLSKDIETWVLDSIKEFVSISVAKGFEKKETEPSIDRLVLLVMLYEPRLLGEIKEFESLVSTFRENLLNSYLEVGSKGENISTGEFENRFIVLDDISNSQKKIAQKIINIFQDYL